MSRIQNPSPPAPPCKDDQQATPDPQAKHDRPAKPGPRSGPWAPQGWSRGLGRRALLIFLLISATLVVHGLTRDGSAMHGSAKYDSEGRLTPSTASQTPDRPTQAAVDFVLPEQLPAPPVAAPVAPTVATSIAAHAPLAPGQVVLQSRLDRQSVLQGSDGRLHLELEIRSGGLPGLETPRVPTDLFVVLDHSGSMSGSKLERAKGATLDLIGRLHQDDRFALVTFSTEARILIAPARATAEQRQIWQRRVAKIRSEGGTNMAGGFTTALGLLSEGYGGSKNSQEATHDRACRLLLLSDGRPDSPDGLHGQARSVAQYGAALSALGIGDDFDEVLMAGLADAGQGNYYYLDRPETLAQVFAGELDAGHGTLAKDLEVAVSLAPGSRLLDAGGYPLRLDGNRVAFHPGHLSANQTRRLWLTFEVDSSSIVDSRPLGRVEMTYATAEGRFSVTPLEQPRLGVVDDSEKYLAGIDSEAWGKAVINEQFGSLQKNVADLVRSGQKDQALRAIDDYSEENSRLNSVLANAEVESNLQEMERLRVEVDQAFEGPDQAGRQKRLVKHQHALAQSLRRVAEAPEPNSGAGGGR